MQAIVKYARGRGHVELRDLPEPVPGPGQVKVQVEAAGVCGSDLHIYYDEIEITIVPPVVVGHEFAGVVVETGPGVKGVAVGDRVTCETTAWSCGACAQCRQGRYNLCTQRIVVGYAIDGCFAEYCLANEQQVHPLPEGVDFLAGALVEPLACCVHAVLELTRISAGDLVVVAGPGTIGLLCLQLARAAGGRVVVCGTSADAERLALASKMGAERTIDVETEDTRARVAEMSQGQGTDVYLECSGAAASARLGLDVVRRGGQYTQVGLFGSPIELAFDRIAYKEILVTGSLGQRPASWERALALLAGGQADTRSLVSHILPLTEWREAFRLMEEQKGLKVVLKP